MAITLYHTGRTPSYTQFGLDQFTEHYTTDSPADIASLDASVPQKGDAHGTYSFMFVTDRHFAETPEKGAAIDIVYTGCMVTSDGSPVLPPVKNSDSDSVRSASTSTSSAIWPRLATSPATVEYYAPTTEIMVFSTTDTSATSCPDPPAVTSLITWTLVSGGEQPALSNSALSNWILNNAFVQGIVETDRATEVVAGQFWQITKTKTTTLYPWAPTGGSGSSSIGLASGGTGYTVSDSLSISSGGQSATITVTSVDVSTGAVAGFTVSANTFTVAHSALAASGGSGSGATFNVFVI